MVMIYSAGGPTPQTEFSDFAVPVSIKPTLSATEVKQDTPLQAQPLTKPTEPEEEDRPAWRDGLQIATGIVEVGGAMLLLGAPEPTGLTKGLGFCLAVKGSADVVLGVTSLLHIDPPGLLAD